MKAGVIRVTLVERGTNKPVAGARIWGFDAETGSSARFSAYTDAQGRATFYSAPSKINLSLAGAPEGLYFEGNLQNDRKANKTFDFAGGETEVALVMPPIAGKLIAVSGICTLPDGSPAQDATVYPRAGRFNTRLDRAAAIQERRTDAAGRFTLEGVPAGAIPRPLRRDRRPQIWRHDDGQGPGEKRSGVPDHHFRLTATVAIERSIEAW